MNKLFTLQLWATGLGIPIAVFDTDRFKFAFKDNDAIDSLRAVQRAVDDGVGMEGWNADRWNEAITNVHNPKHGLEFISIMASKDEATPPDETLDKAEVGSQYLSRDPIVCW